MQISNEHLLVLAQISQSSIDIFGFVQCDWHFLVMHEMKYIRHFLHWDLMPSYPCFLKVHFGKSSVSVFASKHDSISFWISNRRVLCDPIAERSPWVQKSWRGLYGESSKNHKYYHRDKRNSMCLNNDNFSQLKE